MKNVEEQIERINKLLENDFGTVKSIRDNPIRLVLIESLRRSIIWRDVLGSKAKSYYFHHILDDVANSVNIDWQYSSKTDDRLTALPKIDRKDRKIIDNYLNWEIHGEELFNKYHLPNPYEPLICLFELGSGGLVDLENRIEVRTLKKFFVADLMKDMNLLEQQVILDTSVLRQMA